ncbi:MAG: hypothetical protein HY718_13920 [Planctomycetes bacterium]|nr:hypothetical protein [Planctomycetota bacterium]
MSLVGGATDEATMFTIGEFSKIVGLTVKTLRFYAIVMPTREVYIKGPGMIFNGNPRNYLTEIQIPVEAGNSGE